MDNSRLPADGKRQLLRHTVATIAYRGRKVLSGSEGFSQFRIGEKSRTPGEILAHICDLYDWANWLVKGEHVYNESTPGEWAADVDRFFAGLAKLDAWLASEEPLGRSPELLFQGPIADSLTHIGQIALSRRIAGAPVRGESYLRADITIGRVGPDQSPANGGVRLGRRLAIRNGVFGRLSTNWLNWYRGPYTRATRDDCGTLAEALFPPSQEL